MLFQDFYPCLEVIAVEKEYGAVRAHIEFAQGQSCTKAQQIIEGSILLMITLSSWLSIQIQSGIEMIHEEPGGMKLSASPSCTSKAYTPTSTFCC